MKTIFKVIVYTSISIVSLTFLIIIYGMMLMDDYKPETKLFLFASDEVYHGSCNEIFKGNNNIHIKDSVYILTMYDGTKSEIHKSTADFYKETWDSVDKEGDRLESKKCLDLKKDRQKNYSDKKRKQKEEREYIENIINTINNN